MGMQAAGDWVPIGQWNTWHWHPQGICWRRGFVSAGDLLE